MRVASLGYLYQYGETRLREVATATSLITHRHPTAIAATVAAAYLVKLALDGVPISTYMPHLYEFTTGISDEFDLAILRVGHVLGWTNEDLALDHIGQGWVGEEAVALALYCVLRYPDDYVACVRRAADTNGDSDSIACIAGGIMGAKLGLEAIPLDWRSRCENASGISELAQRLTAARST
jgi:ADP-ribosylglycohydrolase